MLAVRETTSVKLEKDIKNEAKKIFRELGLTMGDAFNLFLHQVILNRGLPFEVKIPNEETLQAMRDAKSGINLEQISLGDLENEFKKA